MALVDALDWDGDEVDTNVHSQIDKMASIYFFCLKFKFEINDTRSVVNTQTNCADG